MDRKRMTIIRICFLAYFALLTCTTCSRLDEEANCFSSLIIPVYPCEATKLTKKY